MKTLKRLIAFKEQYIDEKHGPESFQSQSAIIVASVGIPSVVAIVILVSLLS